MKWPLVPRSIYDERVTELAKATAQLEKLTQTIIDMKVTGATVRAATSGTMGLRLPARQPSELDKALDDNARTRRYPGLRAKMRDWAEGELAKSDADEQAIYDRVRNWDKITDADEDDESDDEVLSA